MQQKSKKGTGTFYKKYFAYAKRNNTCKLHIFSWTMLSLSLIEMFLRTIKISTSSVACVSLSISLFQSRNSEWSKKVLNLQHQPALNFCKSFISVLRDKNSHYTFINLRNMLTFIFLKVWDITFFGCLLKFGPMVPKIPSFFANFRLRFFFKSLFQIQFSN